MQFNKIFNSKYVGIKTDPVNPKYIDLDSNMQLGYILKLHNELFLGYDCNKCRNCCAEYSVSFEEDELGPVAAFLRMGEKDFRDKYIKEEFGDYQLNVKPCCFLKEDGRCQIEGCKPASCRDYPYTDKPERLFSLLSIVDSTSICPVVFEMFERLKQEYRFKRRKKY